MEEPAFRPALHGLGELALQTRDQAAVQRLQRDWSALGEAGELEVLALQARWHLANEEWAQARSVLAPAVERLPNAVNLRVLLSHAWLKQGGHETEAEAVLRDILRLAPQHAEARHNLDVLLKTQGRWLAGIEDKPG